MKPNGWAVERRMAGMLLVNLGAAAWAQAQGTTAPAPTPVPGLWDQSAQWIVSPWTTIGLLTLGCLLLFIDLLTPHTWGLMGTLGVLFVGSVFAAHLTSGTAGWIGVIVFLAGIALLLLELHVIPGHGITGMGGLLLLFLGMFWSLGGSQNAAFSLSVSAILTTLSLIGFFAYLPKSPVWKKLGQQMQQRTSLGYVTSDSRMHFLGRAGRAASVLRPSGLADIDGVRLDVVTEGEFLEAGTPVVVIKVEGSRVVVDQAEQAVTAATASKEPSRVV